MYEVLTLNKIAKCGLEMLDKDAFSVSEASERILPITGTTLDIVIFVAFNAAASVVPLITPVKPI